MFNDIKREDSASSGVAVTIQSLSQCSEAVTTRVSVK